MNYRVRIERIAYQIGIPTSTRIGHVNYSGPFEDRVAAEKEARAWNSEGEYEKYGPSNFKAEVESGDFQ